MAKVIRLQPDYNYNHETSDLMNTLLEDHYQKTAKETVEALEQLPIKQLKIQGNTQAEICATLEVAETIHPKTIENMEKKVQQEGFDPIAIEEKLNDEQLAKELKFTLNADEYNIRQKEIEKEYAKAA